MSKLHLSMEGEDSVKITISRAESGEVTHEQVLTSTDGDLAIDFAEPIVVTLEKSDGGATG